MRELALHLLDIAQNSVSAQAQHIEIRVEEDTRADRLRMLVRDDGRGMDAEMLAMVTDAFITTRTTRKVGLGIPLLKAAAEACNGSLGLQSARGQGTELQVEFQRSHLDRMPLGDLASTFLTLLVSFPDIHWRFIYRVDDRTFDFDDRQVKAELEGISLTEPDVLAFFRSFIQEGIAGVAGPLA